MPINYNAALPPDVFLQSGSTAINIGDYINTLRSDINFLIKQLFANSEQGFTQTLDDYSILFQDAAGTTSVTGAGQTLGLVLDKSNNLNLGSEFVTNSWNLSGYPDWSYSNGVLTKSGTTAGGGPNQSNSSPFVTGGLYKIQFEVSGLSAGSLGVMFTGGTNAGPIYVSANGIYTRYLFANSGNSYLRAVVNGASTTGSIKLVSVKQIMGNHSSQSTASYRPLLQNTPRRVQYDGIDDKLTTTLPAQLTGCTVIRAIPNVGCQILTNQTIPTPYNDSTSHCGLIVINRALTAYETSLVTQIFNKLAGV